MEYFGFCQIMHTKVCKKLFVWFMMLMLECHKSLLRIHFAVNKIGSKMQQILQVPILPGSLRVPLLSLKSTYFGLEKKEL